MRNKDNKWYAVIMDVPKNKFGINSEDVVDVLDETIKNMIADSIEKGIISG